MAPFVALAKGRETARPTHTAKQNRTARVLKDVCILGDLIVSQWNAVLFLFFWGGVFFKSPLQCFSNDCRSMSEIMFRKVSHLWGSERFLPCKNWPVSLDDPSITARLLMHPGACYYVDPLNLNLWPPSSLECECWQHFGPFNHQPLLQWKSFICRHRDAVFHCITLATQRFKRSNHPLATQVLYLYVSI